MQEAQLNLKLERGLFQEIELISKVLHIPKSEWARSVLAHELKKEVEEQKSSIVREYLKGTITRKELFSILGRQDAHEVQNIAILGRKSIEDAERIAKEMK